MFGQNNNSGDGDHLSFADSDQFEEDDSVCSWISDSESLVNNWRGWRKNSSSPLHSAKLKAYQPTNLVTLSAKAVAAYFPFELVERSPLPVPEELQKLVAFLSFPRHEEDIRLYSCLACGNADEFVRGEALYRMNAVRDCLQIGFHLTASVVTSYNEYNPATSAGGLHQDGGITSGRIGTQTGVFKVSLEFDRRRIVNCVCSCSAGRPWCSHVVAVCLCRILEADKIKLRAPVSESLSKLSKDDLQKFAQHLICRLPATEILPAAQNILDQLLASSDNQLKRERGAPDPTVGGCLGDVAAWCYNEPILQDNVRKILQKFCIPQPIVYSDPTYMSTNLPAAAQEYQNLLRPLRSKEPEGIWNLLSIIREMFRRRDNNSIPLLEIVTMSLLDMELVVIWWYGVHLSLQLPGKTSQASSQQNHFSAANFCDEMVSLWRLAALDPSLSPRQRHDLESKLRGYHKQALSQAPRGLEKMLAHRAQQSPASGGGGGALPHAAGGSRGRNNGRVGWSAGGSPGGGGGNSSSGAGGDPMAAYFAPATQRLFPGFKPSIEACMMTWDEFPLPDISDASGRLCFPSPDSRHHSGDLGGAGPSGTMRGKTRQRSSSGRRSRHASLRDTRLGTMRYGDAAVATHSSPYSGDPIVGPRLEHQSSVERASPQTDGGASSSSEGFCENESLFAPIGVRGAGAGSTSGPQLTPFSSVDEDQQPGTSGGGPGSFDDYEGSGGSRRDLDSEEVAGSGNHVASGSSSRASGGERRKGGHSATAESADDDLVGEIHPTSNPQEVMYCRCQALYYHGYPREAASLARELAKQMLETGEELCQASAAVALQVCRSSIGGQAGLGGARSARRQRANAGGPTAAQGGGLGPNGINTGQIDYARLASQTISRTLFLTTCLLEESSSNTELAFDLCLLALCLPRPPARERPLEVKLLYQEMELLVAMRRIPVSNASLALLKEKAQRMKEGSLSYPADAHLPYSLAFYLFEQLSLPYLQATSGAVCPPGIAVGANTSSSFFGAPAPGGPGGSSSSAVARGATGGDRLGHHRLSTGDRAAGRQNPAAAAAIGRQSTTTSGPTPPPRTPDEALLGFEAAVAAVGLKPAVPEHAYPLLIEGQRRQRDELAALLFVMYKEDVAKLSRVLDQLLDRKVNPHFKAPPLSMCLSSSVADLMAWREPPPPPPAPKVTHMGGAEAEDQEERNDDPRCESRSSPATRSPCETPYRYTPTKQTPAPQQAQVTQPGPSKVSSPARSQPLLSKGIRGATASVSRDTDSSALEDEVENPAAYKAWEEKFRCTNLKSARKLSHHSVGMAAVDSSAPETTSSDNSPTTVRRTMPISAIGLGVGPRPQPDSDSSCGGQSSDSDSRGQAQQVQSPGLARSRVPTNGPTLATGPSITAVRTGAPGPAPRAAHHEPNRPTESMAHHMFELAQTILNKAGGSGASASVFNHTNAFSVAHRNLQLCAFQIGLYALGLYNALNPSWQSRTYSSHVAWITTQVMDNGVVSACIILHSWMHHLNPAEVANIADRCCSRSRDTQMVAVAAELCLACLSECSTLNPKEILRALQQCKEQSNEMLERGLHSVESGANNSLSGVMPEIFFDLAQYWYTLYESVAPISQQQQTVHGLQLAQHIQQQNQLYRLPAFANVTPPMIQFAFQSGASPAQIHQFQQQMAQAQSNQFGVHGFPVTSTGAPVVPPGFSTAPHHGAHAQGGMRVGPHMLPVPLAHQFAAATLHHYSSPHPFVQVRPFLSLPGHSSRVFPGAFSNPVPPHPLYTTPVSVHQSHGAPALTQQHAGHYLQKAFQCAMRAIKVLYQPSNGRSDPVIASNRELQRFNTLTQHAAPQHAPKIKWTLEIAKLLGPAAVQEYCNHVVICIQDHCLMKDIASEVIDFHRGTTSQTTAGASQGSVLGSPDPAFGLAHPGQGQTVGVLSPELVNKMINRVHSLFKKDIENRLQHIGQGQAEWDELVEVILQAHRAYHRLPSTTDPSLTWSLLLSRIQRHPRCKDDLWSRIMAGVNTLGLR